MSKFGPNAHLASAVVNWAPYYEKAMRDALEGTWKPEKTWWGVKEGAIDLVSLSEKVPAEIRSKVEDVKKGLKGETFVIWKGPIKDQSDKEVLKAGTKADNAFLLGIDFYVKGVEGSLPSRK
jgi:simple sugar transport system substrate-binding protein